MSLKKQKKKISDTRDDKTEMLEHGLLCRSVLTECKRKTLTYIDWRDIAFAAAKDDESLKDLLDMLDAYEDGVDVARSFQREDGEVVTMEYEVFNHQDDPDFQKKFVRAVMLELKKKGLKMGEFSRIGEGQVLKKSSYRPFWTLSPKVFTAKAKSIDDVQCIVISGSQGTGKTDTAFWGFEQCADEGLIGIGNSPLLPISEYHKDRRLVKKYERLNLDEQAWEIVERRMNNYTHVGGMRELLTQVCLNKLQGDVQIDLLYDEARLNWDRIRTLMPQEMAQGMIAFILRKMSVNMRFLAQEERMVPKDIADICTMEIIKESKTTMRLYIDELGVYDTYYDVFETWLPFKSDHISVFNALDVNLSSLWKALQKLKPNENQYQFILDWLDRDKSSLDLTDEFLQLLVYYMRGGKLPDYDDMDDDKIKELVIPYGQLAQLTGKPTSTLKDIAGRQDLPKVRTGPTKQKKGG